RMIQQRQLHRSEFGSDNSIQHSDSNESGEHIPLPRIGGNYGRGGMLAGTKGNTSTDQDVYDCGVFSDALLGGTPVASIFGGRTEAGTSAGAMADGNFINVATTNSSAASSMAGGQRLSGGASSMRVRPSPGLQGSASTHLVSNFSPLTLPSTPGSSNCNLQPTEAITDVEDNDLADDDLVDDNLEDDESGSELDGSRYSDESAISKPMTQAVGSEQSLSMYSATSGHGSYVSSVNISNADETFDDDNWDDDVSSMRSDDRSGGCEFSGTSSLPPLAAGGESLASLNFQGGLNGMHRGAINVGEMIYQLPQFAKFSREVLLGVGGSSSDSAFITSGYVSSDLDYIEFREEDKDNGRASEDWGSEDDYDVDDDLDTGTVISQEDQAEHQGALTPGELVSATSFLGRLDMNQLSAYSSASSQPSDDDAADGADAREYESQIGSASNSDSGTESDTGLEISAMSRLDCRLAETDAAYTSNGDNDSSSDAEDGDSDAEIGGTGQQDTVLFVGKFNPKQERGSGSFMMSTLANAAQRRQSNADATRPAANTGLRSQERLLVSPSPIPRCVRCSSTAEYPQRVMKKSQQQRRNERVPQLKDSTRMVESLRRMGKWHDSALASGTSSDQAVKPNYFYLDPGIISMSPRLVPQQSAGNH
ncbi:hypothetical protein GGF37_004530, partial [Kickxella alabastrina]